MKRIVSFLLACVMLMTSCASTSDNSVSVNMGSVQESATEDGSQGNVNENSGEIKEDNDAVSVEDVVEDSQNDNDLSFKVNGLDDEALIGYVEDNIYASLINELDSEDYYVENIEAVYYPKEYIEALASNSQSNLYFGYTSDELNELFEGTRYVFTLGEDGETAVVPMETVSDDVYIKAMEDVLIGSGVILICVTVSLVAAPTAPSVAMIFTAAAKTGTVFALESGGLGFAAAAIAKGYETESFEQALKAGAEAGAEGFKWGAIIGAVVGGIGKAHKLREAAKVIDEQLADPAVSEWRKAELRALKKYGGEEQLTFLAGEEVPHGTPGATRPDIIRQVGDHYEAIEVKYYDLNNPGCRSTLYKELEREVAARMLDLPKNSTQRVVLDVTGRQFSKETIKEVVEAIQSRLLGIYGKKIPVDILGR